MQRGRQHEVEKTELDSGDGWCQFNDSKTAEKEQDRKAKEA